jgi:hypothetical protein
MKAAATTRMKAAAAATMSAAAAAAMSAAAMSAGRLGAGQSDRKCKQTDRCNRCDMLKFRHRNLLMSYADLKTSHSK